MHVHRRNICQLYFGWVNVGPGSSTRHCLTRIGSEWFPGSHRRQCNITQIFAHPGFRTKHELPHPGISLTQGAPTLRELPHSRSSHTPGIPTPHEPPPWRGSHTAGGRRLLAAMVLHIICNLQLSDSCQQPRDHADDSQWTFEQS